jgi:hypothetical protein
MKNQHVPFELLGDIRAWVNKNVSASLANDATAELKKVTKLIDDLSNMSLEVPEDLLKRREELEAMVNTPNEDKLMLQDLAEKLSSLANDIKKLMRKPGGGTKAPPKTLSVTLRDGRIICENKAVDTFIETLRYMGLDKCAEIEDVTHLGHPVVSTVRNKYINRKPGNIREIDGYFIETKTNTERKGKQLKDYAQRLGINIQVRHSD